MIERYYRQRPILLRPKWQFAFLGVVVLLVALSIPWDGNRAAFTIVMLGSYCVLAAIGLAVIRVFVFQTYRYSSYFGTSSRCTISDRGLQVSGGWPDYTVEWAAFRSAVRFRDGIMLLRLVPERALGGLKYAVSWLPDAALQQSSPSDVDRFVGEKMPIRDVA